MEFFQAEYLSLLIHWYLPDELDKGIFHKSILLSSVILTIPLIGFDDKKFKLFKYKSNKIIHDESSLRALNR